MHAYLYLHDDEVLLSLNHYSQDIRWNLHDYEDICVFNHFSLNIVQYIHNHEETR
jgi:hypothetical protein